MVQNKFLKIALFLIILCLTLPLVYPTIWDSPGLSKFKDIFVTYTNWKRNVNGSGFDIIADNFIKSDGSSIGGGDSLGNHTASEDLNMSGNDISIPDNNANAFSIKEGVTSYLTFVTSNSAEKLIFNKEADFAADLLASALKSSNTPTTFLDLSGGNSFHQYVNNFKILFVLAFAGNRFVQFNPDLGDIDFVVKGDTDGDLLYVNAGTDKVGIGTSSPSSKLHVVGNITGSISAEDVDRDLPSNCPASSAVIGWGDNLSTTVCTSFLQTPDSLGNHTASQDLNMSSNDILMRATNKIFLDGVSFIYAISDQIRLDSKSGIIQFSESTDINGTFTIIGGDTSTTVKYKTETLGNSRIEGFDVVFPWRLTFAPEFGIQGGIINMETAVNIVSTVGKEGTTTKGNLFVEGNLTIGNYTIGILNDNLYFWNVTGEPLMRLNRSGGLATRGTQQQNWDGT